MAIKVPGQDNEQIILVVDVQVTRTLPLAKGGGVATAGATVTQADIKAAHEGNALLWTNSKGGKERYYIVRPAAVGAVAEDGTEIPAPELTPELEEARFWYFPSDEGRPGRGLTLPDGVKLGAAAAAAREDANEGNIAPTPVAAPALKPALVAKAPVAVAKPVAVAPKAPVAVAKPVAAPVVAKPAAVAAPALIAKRPALVLPKKA